MAALTWPFSVALDGNGDGAITLNTAGKFVDRNIVVSVDAQAATFKKVEGGAIDSNTIIVSGAGTNIKTSSSATSYYFTTQADISVDAETINIASPGWVSSDLQLKIDASSDTKQNIFYVAGASLSAAATDSIEYTTRDDIVASAANGYIYINEGYIPNTKIDIGALIPDFNGKDAVADYILQGYLAYDDAGNTLTGIMPYSNLSPVIENGEGVFVARTEMPTISITQKNGAVTITKDITVDTVTETTNGKYNAEVDITSIYDAELDATKGYIKTEDDKTSVTLNGNNSFNNTLNLSIVKGSVEVTEVDKSATAAADITITDADMEIVRSDGKTDGLDGIKESHDGMTNYLTLSTASIEKTGEFKDTIKLTCTEGYITDSDTNPISIDTTFDFQVNSIIKYIEIYNGQYTEGDSSST